MLGVTNKTTNGGSNWERLTLSGSENMNSIFFLDYDIGYCGGGSGEIHKTTDGGDNWLLLKTGLTTEINSVYFVDKDTGYACGDDGKIIKTTDGGYKWFNQPSGFGNDLYCAIMTSVDTGYIFGKNGAILKTVNGGGLSKTKKIHVSVPSSFYLYQNYPNPFNPTTKIKFDLPKSTQAKLVIYDILGREVTTLVNEKLNAGSYEVEWPAPTGTAGIYPSGVYFYRLETSDYNSVKKMLLIK